MNVGEVDDLIPHDIAPAGFNSFGNLTWNNSLGLRHLSTAAFA
jgi:hypothetical protein